MIKTWMTCLLRHAMRGKLGNIRDKIVEKGEGWGVGALEYIGVGRKQEFGGGRRREG